MKITTIRCSAGCTIPHPHESYSNIKLFAELSAELEPSEDQAVAVAQLQEAVHALLSAERDKRLNAIEEEHQEQEARRRAEHEKQQAIYAAERKLNEAQRVLERLQNGASEDEMPF